MPTVNWHEFVNLEYWFEGIAGERGMVDTQPGVGLIIQTDSWFFWAYLTIFASFICLAIVLKASQAFFDEKHPLQRQIPFWSSQLFLMGFLGFGWFFCRQINVIYLNSRLFLLVGLLWVLVFLVLVFRYFFRFYPLEIQSYHKFKSSLTDKASQNS
jgi:hypothetical protein